MNAYDFVHLTFLVSNEFLVSDEKIKGKTKLQKTVYFLGVLTESLDDLGYRPHYYGPYSSEVAFAVDKLKALDFVAETRASSGAANPSGFEVTRYDFSLTDDGKQVAKLKAEQNHELWEKMQAAAKQLRKAGDPDYMKLSIAAKIHFMLGTRKRVTTQELSQQAKKFGWRVSEAKALAAARLLETIGLVKVLHT